MSKHKMAFINIRGQKYLIEADVRKRLPNDEISFDIDGEEFTVEYQISKEIKDADTRTS